MESESSRERDRGYKEANDAPVMLEPPSCSIENGGQGRKGHQKGLRRATEGMAGGSPEPGLLRTSYLTQLGPFPSPSSPGNNPLWTFLGGSQGLREWEGRSTLWTMLPSQPCRKSCLLSVTFWVPPVAPLRLLPQHNTTHQGSAAHNPCALPSSA